MVFGQVLSSSPGKPKSKASPHITGHIKVRYQLDKETYLYEATHRKRSPASVGAEYPLRVSTLHPSNAKPNNLLEL